MPIWLIESFGGAYLQQAFVVIAVMTAPIWLLMLCLPKSKFVQFIARPHVAPPFYCLILGFLVWKAVELSIFPDSPKAFHYNEAQGMVRHPMMFLILFCNWQIVCLVLGTGMFERARISRMNVTFELLICWFFGAWALVPYGIRLGLRGWKK